MSGNLARDTWLLLRVCTGQAVGTRRFLQNKSQLVVRRHASSLQWCSSRKPHTVSCRMLTSLHIQHVFPLFRQDFSAIERFGFLQAGPPPCIARAQRPLHNRLHCHKERSSMVLYCDNIEYNFSGAIMPHVKKVPCGTTLKWFCREPSRNYKPLLSQQEKLQTSSISELFKNYIGITLLFNLHETTGFPCSYTEPIPSRKEVAYRFVCQRDAIKSFWLNKPEVRSLFGLWLLKWHKVCWGYEQWNQRVTFLLRLFHSTSFTHQGPPRLRTTGIFIYLLIYFIWPKVSRGT